MAFSFFKKSEKKDETHSGPRYFDLRVKQIIPETKDAISIAFEAPADRKIAYKSGQFLTLITTIGGRECGAPTPCAPHPLSIMTWS